MAAMSGDDGRRQRAAMAPGAEWDRIGRAAAASDMDRSRFVVHHALMAEALPREVLRRSVSETLVLSLLEERRLREAGAGSAWEDAGPAETVAEQVVRLQMRERLRAPTRVPGPAAVITTPAHRPGYPPRRPAACPRRPGGRAPSQR